jgi:sterol desaturase/sphingolipid hydroxylase (fatty acid hydroxylase superfamily)
MKTWLNLFRRSRCGYYADLLITPPITLALLVLSLTQGLSWLWPLQFVIGVLAWTLYEYATHRWLLHRVPLFRQVHALHHARQKDYIAVHPAATLALYGVLFWLFGANGSALTLGFSSGYIAYSCMHGAFHYAVIGEGHWLYRLKLRHAAHHRSEVNFGVSTSLWDRVFGTEGK